MPKLITVRAAAFQRGAGDPAMTDVAADPVTELNRCRTVEAGPVSGHSGGMERPRAPFGSGLPRAGLKGSDTGVVSNPNKPLGVLSTEVHNAKSLSHFTYIRCLVSNSVTDTHDCDFPSPSANR